MPSVTLRAHYDGKQILLDERYDLPRNVPLMVTVLPVVAPDSEGAQWAAAAAEGLAAAYGEDEPEYTLADIRP